MKTFLLAVPLAADMKAVAKDPPDLAAAARLSAATPILPEVMGPIERLAGEMWPGIPVLPVMDPWAGDSAQVRRAGIPTYGASGVFSGDNGNEHGANERISADAYYESVEYAYRLMKLLAADAPSR